MKEAQLKIGFNLIGKLYNPLKCLVLGNTPETIITHAISKSAPTGDILVIGGGGDNTTLELLKNPEVTSITLVDISSVLLEKAKHRLKGHLSQSKVKFKEVSFLNYATNLKFDGIICPFYLDLFTDKEVQENIKRFKDLLHPKGKVLVIDFCEREDSSKKGKVITALLYLSFLVITRTFRFTIPRFKLLFLKHGFILNQKELVKEKYQFLSFKMPN